MGWEVYHRLLRRGGNRVPKVKGTRRNYRKKIPNIVQYFAIKFAIEKAPRDGD